MTTLRNLVIIAQRTFSPGEFSSSCGLYMLIPMQIKNPLTHPIIILAYFAHVFGEIIALMLCFGRRTHPSPYCCHDKR